METNRWNIHDLTQMALLVALLSASAYLAFPIPITLVTVTAQTLVLNLIALLLDRRKAALTVAVWILLGAVGIPVYSGGRGGLSELVGPTGGPLHRHPSDRSGRGRLVQVLRRHRLGHCAAHHRPPLPARRHHQGGGRHPAGQTHCHRPV